jgi:molecular chaperone DnaK (HSP70)
MAGVSVRRIINEPSAAALLYGFHDRQSQHRLLVVDLGGGTFDVTLMQVSDGVLEIVSTAGDGNLGGEDFTDRLVAWALRREGISLEAAELKQPLRVARLRLPVLRRWVEDLFRREPICSHNPDEVVALGAAVHAAVIADDRAVGDLVVTDICPFSLGIEVVKEFGEQLVDGYYLPVIHRNTTIPVSREEIVATTR